MMLRIKKKKTVDFVKDRNNVTDRRSVDFVSEINNVTKPHYETQMLTLFQNYYLITGSYYFFSFCISISVINPCSGLLFALGSCASLLHKQISVPLSLLHISLLGVMVSATDLRFVGLKREAIVRELYFSGRI